MAEKEQKVKDDLQKPEILAERVFLADDLIPNAAEAFSASVEPVEKAIKTATVVLDTNVLLLPYGAGSDSLQQIIEVFKDLAAKKRLFLPAQVVREFIRNRPSKVAELQKQLFDKTSQYTSIPKLSFPILDGTPEYAALNDALVKTSEVKKELSKACAAVVDAIQAWEWNDPVHSAYREVFKLETVVQPNTDRGKTLAELRRRQRLQIPPGYKDASKDDAGIGDFLIWETILEIGAKNKMPLIFVSGDEKTDWQHRSNGRGFLPRYELLDEFRRHTGGQSFYIIPLSRLLDLMKVGAASVEEIKKEEERIQEANSAVVDCPFCSTQFVSRLGDHIGASAKPRCPECERAFYVHRTQQGITVPVPYEKRASDMPDGSDMKAELVQCPSCEAEIKTQLSTRPNSTAWCPCGRCGVTFPLHRKPDGSVYHGGFRLNSA